MKLEELNHEWTRIHPVQPLAATMRLNRKFAQIIANSLKE